MPTMNSHLPSFQIINNAQYGHLNTFNITGQTSYLAEVHRPDDLPIAIEFAEKSATPYIVLGGGSNVLMTQNFAGLIIHMAIPGINMLEETADHVFLRVGSGVIWHDFVCYCLQHHYYGIENLSLIPGTVGAAPIQNIGAYGVELKDIFHELEAFDIASKKIVKFDFAACEFSYRNSVFKIIKDRYLIQNVTLRLNKKSAVTLTDKSVQKELDILKMTNPHPKELSEIICNIRRRKLPYDKGIGNAGSFFMNPYISQQHFAEIHSEYNDAIGFPMQTGLVKIAAGWMIDKCGWRGYREGDAGVYEHNALVLVNHGNATGQDILHLAQKIKDSIKKQFDISLEIEPRIY